MEIFRGVLPESDALSVLRRGIVLTGTLFMRAEIMNHDYGD